MRSTRVCISFLAPLCLLISTATAKSNNIEPEARTNDPLQIVVSLKEQRLTVVRGGQQIATSPISTGKPGHSTPPGIYSILNKRKRHYSSIYDGAPMPFMQRLTWTGIALHGSNSVPDYPASHGCIRLPGGFDQELYAMTDVGAHVIVNSEMIDPQKVEHPLMLQPKPPRAYDPLLDHWRLRMQMGGPLNAETARKVSTAAMLAPIARRISFEANASEDDAPLRILITRRTHTEILMDLQRLMNRLGYDAGTVDGIIGPSSRAAIRRFQQEHGLELTGAVDGNFSGALYDAAGLAAPQNGKLLVRRDFKPMFEAPIAIADGSTPLGTHLIVAANFDAHAGSTDWSGYTLENRISASTRALYGIDPEADDKIDLTATLSRITISDDLRDRLSGLLTPGSSIAIADSGTQRYTGWKTDFVVNTKVDRGEEYALVPETKARSVKRQRDVGQVRSRDRQRTVRYSYARRRAWQPLNPLREFLRMW
jgi:peptidoglycan hydrolase-like protein with peptidoglycan-binding domain